MESKNSSKFIYNPERITLTVGNKSVEIPTDKLFRAALKGDSSLLYSEQSNTMGIQSTSCIDKVNRIIENCSKPTHSVPSPYLTASEELYRIQRQLPELLQTFKNYQVDKMLNNDIEDDWPFLYDSGEFGVFKMDKKTCGDMKRWFFIGDIHGDFFALHTLLNWIRKQNKDFRICFLGDLVDRGTHSLECFAYFLEWAYAYPERIIWIAGNHDIAFSYKSETDEFLSDVHPSEFLEYLNCPDSMKGFRSQFGKYFIELTKRLPRAVLFPNGLLATHGGIPHDDLQNELVAAENDVERWKLLNSDRYKQDFTWTRIHRNPKKFPNRNSKGCEYGFQNFERFCQVTKDFFSIKHMVNAHEHPEQGFDPQEKYKINRVLTLRGFGFHTLNPGFTAYRDYLPKLFLSQGEDEGPPKIIPVEYQTVALRVFFPDTEEKFYRLFPELKPLPPIIKEPTPIDTQAVSSESSVSQTSVSDVKESQTVTTSPIIDNKNTPTNKDNENT